MSNKIGILTNGPRAWSSSRLRGYWYEDFAPLRFKVYAPGDVMDGIDECEAVVFQKRQGKSDIERAKRYKAEGRTVIYDITEPMWWWNPAEVDEMFRIADAVTTSNDALTAAVRLHDAVDHAVTIPDRMMPSLHPTVAEHGERERVVLVWFGNGGNRIPCLVGALPLLGYAAKHVPLELRIIDDAPHVKLDSGTDLKIVNVPWAIETFHAQMIACDVAVLPPYPGPWGTMKSNNKEVSAWWCGLPTTSGFDFEDLARLLQSTDERAKDGAANRKKAEAEYGIEKSIAQWLELVEHLKTDVSGLMDQTVKREEASHAAV